MGREDGTLVDWAMKMGHLLTGQGRLYNILYSVLFCIFILGNVIDLKKWLKEISFG